MKIKESQLSAIEIAASHQDFDGDFQHMQVAMWVVAQLRPFLDVEDDSAEMRQHAIDTLQVVLPHRSREFLTDIHDGITAPR